MTPTEARSTYRVFLNASGEYITLRRPGVIDVTVQACVFKAQPSDVTGSVQINSRMFVVMHDDVIGGGFPVPIRAKSDQLVWNGRVLPIVAVEDGKRRTQGETIAYELNTSGA